MIISNAAIGWILAIAGTFGVNYAQIQVNASDIENNEEKFEYIQDQLSSIEEFLRNQHNDHDHEDKENND